MPDLLVPPFLEVSFPEHKVSTLGITLNVGKQRISKVDFENLVNLLNKKKVINSFIEMRQGAIVNLSEKRQALHTSLRDPSLEAPYSRDVHKTLDRICQFAERVRNWKWLGCRGDRITDVINIGIGGSDMGPRAVYNALRTTRPEIKVHFLASADGVALDRLTAELDPYKTLIIISSKSFNTLETLSNTKEIFGWLKNFGFKDDDYKHHVVAVSANPKAANSLGLPDENFFQSGTGSEAVSLFGGGRFTGGYFAWRKCISAVFNGSAPNGCPHSIGSDSKKSPSTSCSFFLLEYRKPGNFFFLFLTLR